MHGDVESDTGCHGPCATVCLYMYIEKFFHSALMNKLHNPFRVHTAPDPRTVNPLYTGSGVIWLQCVYFMGKLTHY